MSEAENERRVRAFYEATIPGHRESLRGLQSPHVVYDLPKGMPIACGHFEGLQDVLDRFLTSFYNALDVHFVTEEFISAGDEVVALGHIEGKTRKAAVASMCLSPTSGQSAMGICNACVLSPTQPCSLMRWENSETFHVSDR